MPKRDVDKYFPRNGPCVCHTTRYARHRVIDAIKSGRRAGDSVNALAEDYGLSRRAILAALDSSPDDNRMTKKEILEHKAVWASLIEEMKREAVA